LEEGNSGRFSLIVSLADAYNAPPLLEALLAGGHRAAEIGVGEVMAGPPRFELV
jgi:hypothetical protein